MSTGRSTIVQRYIGSLTAVKAHSQEADPQSAMWCELLRWPNLWDSQAGKATESLRGVIALPRTGEAAPLSGHNARQISDVREVEPTTGRRLRTHFSALCELRPCAFWRHAAPALDVMPRMEPASGVLASEQVRRRDTRGRTRARLWSGT